jgi:hypothetical protein
VDCFGLEITYHHGGGFLQPGDNTPYLSGETFKENMAAAGYNAIPWGRPRVPMAGYTHG